MAKWSVVTNPRGVYTSPIHSIGNTLDKYVATINIDSQNIHNEKVEYYFRVSHDVIKWTEWERFYETSHDLLDNYKLNGLYFQYKIVMVSKQESTKPYVKAIKMDFEPFSSVENIGDLPVSPKIWIKKINGSGTVALINHTTGQRVELENLNNNEEVYIDCENEEIVSSNQEFGVYRYDSHNDEFLELIRGENYLTSEGDFDLDIRFRAKLLQE